MTSTLMILALLAGCGRCDKLEAVGYGDQRCPAGDIKLSLSAQVMDVQRGKLGQLTLTTRVSWIQDGERSSQTISKPFAGEIKVAARLEGTDVPVVLTALEVDPIRRGTRVGRITLPDVPDGDHVLVLEVDAGFDQQSVRLPLSFYSPALVHVLSDRPIYRPGEDINLRSLVLARADQIPLGDRPGRWKVVSSDGIELLDEPVQAGSWGVASTSLPLDSEAPHGTYRATYTSGADSDTITFEVKPFELPKITMELSSSRAWSEAGEPVAVEGIARYRSGAPIANTEVEVQLRAVSGAWPLPLDWTKEVTAKTGGDGSFRVSWGEVPNDIRDLVKLRAQAVITEKGGERTVASAKIILSEHPIQAVALTELGDRLAAGRNNRAYVRLMRPDGSPLPHSDVSVTNPWNPALRASQARADEDGVISIQLDPGDPVTLVTEPMPIRRPPPPPPVRADAPKVRTLNRSFGVALDLMEQRVIPALEERLRPCQYVEKGAKSVEAGIRVVAGSVKVVKVDEEGATARCVERALVGLRWPTSGPETYTAVLDLPASWRPFFDVQTEVSLGNDVDEVLEEAAGRARSCVQPGEGNDGEHVLSLHWLVGRDSDRIGVDIARGQKSGLSSSALGCMERFFTGLRLEEKREEAAMGSTRFRLRVPLLPGAPPPPPVPQATTSEGFELTVRVKKDGALVGSTPLRFGVGSMPPVRVRATPPVVRAGQRVTFEILRSGDLDLKLPKELVLLQHGKAVAKEELDGNKVVFDVPDDASGFMEVEFYGSMARVFVERVDHLALTLTPDKTVYRPGDVAQIEVKTTAGEAGRRAAVGLIGVDASLGQLMPLPGPDAYGRVTVRAKSDQPAFGSFDAHALLLGRIRGENARQAAVLRISSVPTDRFTRPVVNGSGEAVPDQATAFAHAFERALVRTAERLREWEKSAPPEEKIDNPKMKALWEQALADLREGGQPALDAYGRELQLRFLPPSYLDQLDPKNLVGDGTRLPEDMTSWAHWLAKEVKDG